MNILIVGSSGFIASHLNFELVKKHNIYGFDKKKSINTKFLADVIQELVLNKLPKKIDVIINLAAVHREPGHKLHEYFTTNILGAENVCDFAEKVKCNRIIFTSSISPYGIENRLNMKFLSTISFNTVFIY